MFAPPDALLPSLAAAIGVGVPLFAAKARGRTYALFALVLVTLSFPAGVVLALRLIELSGPRLGPLVGWLFVYGIAATGLHMASLVRARLRRRWVRYAMSVPGMAMLALGALALPFLVVLAPLRGLLDMAGADRALAVLAYADWLPVLAIVHALATSFGARREFVRIDLGRGGEPETLRRVAVERAFEPLAPAPRRPFRFVQISRPAPRSLAARAPARAPRRPSSSRTSPISCCSPATSSRWRATARPARSRRRSRRSRRCRPLLRDLRQPRPRGARGGAARARRERHRAC